MSSRPSEPPAAPKRRAHRKSRAGCAECRRRRIKCGEERPCCRACLRHNVSCRYPDGAQASSVAPYPSPDHSCSAAQPSPDIQGEESMITSNPRVPFIPRSYVGEQPESRTTTPMPAFDFSDLALLHHWTISASISIINTAPGSHCWQVIYPQIGAQHPFVMHGILSLAALHLAYTGRDNSMQYTLAASHHSSKAMEGFRASMNNMGKHNCDALFACATLNMVYVFGTLGRRHHENEENHSHSTYTSRVLGTEWIPLISGVVSVVLPVMQLVQSGPLGPFLELANWEQLDPDVAQDYHFREIRGAWTNDDNAKVYDDALFIVRKCYMYHIHFAETSPEETMKSESFELWGWNREWAGHLRFLFYAPEEFFPLLRQRQPPALLIFAYFGALLYSSNSYWFLEGWGQDIVEVVDSILGDYGEHWMLWPKEVVGLS